MLTLAEFADAGENKSSLPSGIGGVTRYGSENRTLAVWIAPRNQSIFSLSNCVASASVPVRKVPDPKLATLIAIYTGAPLWVGAIGCLSGGYAVSGIDRFLNNRRQSRCVLGMIALLSCALCWGIASQTESLHVFCISVAMAAFCIDLTLGASWATCQDIGKDHTAVASAFMNTIGTLGAALAGWLTGTLVERSISQRAVLEHVPASGLTEAVRHQAALDGYQFVFVTYALVYIVAAFCWFLVLKSMSLSDPAE